MCSKNKTALYYSIMKNKEKNKRIVNMLIKKNINISEEEEKLIEIWKMNN